MKLSILPKRILNLFLATCGLALAACSGPLTIPTVTSTSFLTETLTPTVVWFPPTDTPSFIPTKSPASTEDLHPGVGSLSFSDSFVQSELWNTSGSEQASATVTRNRLVLSISGPGPLSIISLRSQPVLDDFYAETQVDISLCSGKDQYGMLFRASGNDDYYRFAVNCNGQLHLERLRAGEAYPLLDWFSSGDAPVGAPAQVKMGLWAVGREMRLFLNDHYQVSLLDPIFSSGTIGFFVFASGQSPVTISFSNLTVYSIYYISPTPTQSPTLTPTPTLPPNP
jgi:hypothetical protein